MRRGQETQRGRAAAAPRAGAAGELPSSARGDPGKKGCALAAGGLPGRGRGRAPSPPRRPVPTARRARAGHEGRVPTREPAALAPAQPGRSLTHRALAPPPAPTTASACGVGPQSRLRPRRALPSSSRRRAPGPGALCGRLGSGQGARDSPPPHRGLATPRSPRPAPAAASQQSAQPEPRRFGRALIGCPARPGRTRLGGRLSITPLVGRAPPSRSRPGSLARRWRLPSRVLCLRGWLSPPAPRSAGVSPALLGSRPTHPSLPLLAEGFGGSVGASVSALLCFFEPHLKKKKQFIYRKKKKKRYAGERLVIQSPRENTSPASPCPQGLSFAWTRKCMCCSLRNLLASKEVSILSESPLRSPRPAFGLRRGGNWELSPTTCNTDECAFCLLCFCKQNVARFVNKILG